MRRNNYNLLTDITPSRIYYNDGLDESTNHNLNNNSRKLQPMKSKNRKIKVL